jgi:hypothetical protein
MLHQQQQDNKQQLQQQLNQQPQPPVFPLLPPPPSPPPPPLPHREFHSWPPHQQALYVQQLRQDLSRLPPPPPPSQPILLSLLFQQSGRTFIPCPPTAPTVASQTSFLTPPPPTTRKTTPLLLEKTAIGWRVKAPRITAPIVWRRIPTIITPNWGEPHRCSGDLPPHPVESHLTHSWRSSRRNQSPRTRRPSHSESPEPPVPLGEELEETSLKLLKLTRRVLALTNRHSTTTPSSIRLTDIRKERAALYRLCRELRRTSSSDSGRPSDSDPGSSRTNSSGPSTTYDPRHWRPSDTAVSSPSSSPRSEDRYTPTPIHLLPPAAHPSCDLPGLANQLRDSLSFHPSEPQALDLRSHRPVPQ